MEEDFNNNRVTGAYKYLKTIRNVYKPQTNIGKTKKVKLLVIDKM